MTRRTPTGARERNALPSRNRSAGGKPASPKPKGELGAPGDARAAHKAIGALHSARNKLADASERYVSAIGKVFPLGSRIVCCIGRSVFEAEVVYIHSLGSSLGRIRVTNRTTGKARVVHVDACVTASGWRGRDVSPEAVAMAGALRETS